MHHPRVALALVCALGGCSLLIPVVEEKDDAGTDAALDGAFDAIDDSTDAGSDAVQDGRVYDTDTLFCGPDLTCSRAASSTVCCVTTADAGSPPDSYVFTCESNKACPAVNEGGSPPQITCDQREDCVGAAACCWSSSVTPIHTYCYDVDASACVVELCDPGDQPPCVNHPGNQCVPSGNDVPKGKITPLGYFVCVP